MPVGMRKGNVLSDLQALQFGKKHELPVQIN
jgi:hypothetical protein